MIIIKEIKFRKSKWTLDDDGTWVCFLAENPLAAKQIISKIEDKEYIVQIKRYYPKRSLDANAYAWTLLHQLAVKLELAPEEIYRQHIRDVGDNYELICLKDDAIPVFDRMWSKNGLGWITEVKSPCSMQRGYSWVYAYYGSSEFNSAQMSRFIEMVIQDCREQGIETMMPDEIERLKAQWQAKEQEH